MSDDDKLTPEEILKANQRAFGRQSGRKKREPPPPLDEIEARFAEGPLGEVIGIEARGVVARTRLSRMADPPPPTTWLDLIKQGGPMVHVGAAAWRAYRKAAREEAGRWLEILEENRPEIDADSGRDDVVIASIINGYVKTLRRAAGVRPPLEEVRAQTRERVRRLRERRRAGRTITKPNTLSAM
jgi:hypothetical protein